jgi:Glycosyl transferase family 2
VRAVGGFRGGLEGAHEWDLALRVLEHAPAAAVSHLPFVLYHRRRRNDLAESPARRRACESAQRAVGEHLELTRQEAVAIPLPRPGGLRIRRSIPAPPPVVSAVIPTRDQGELLCRCMDGLLSRTEYAPLEPVVVDNGSVDADTRALLARLCAEEGVDVVEDGGPYNLSRLYNVGIAASRGEVCLLFNDDIEVIDSG